MFVDPELLRRCGARICESGEYVSGASGQLACIDAGLDIFGGFAAARTTAVHLAAVTCADRDVLSSHVASAELIAGKVEQSAAAVDETEDANVAAIRAAVTPVLSRCDEK